MEQLETVITIY